MPRSSAHFHNPPQRPTLQLFRFRGVLTLRLHPQHRRRREQRGGFRVEAELLQEGGYSVQQAHQGNLHMQRQPKRLP